MMKKNSDGVDDVTQAPPYTPPGLNFLLLILLMLMILMILLILLSLLLLVSLLL